MLSKELSIYAQPAADIGVRLQSWGKQSWGRQRGTKGQKRPIWWQGRQQSWKRTRTDEPDELPIEPEEPDDAVVQPAPAPAVVPKAPTAPLAPPVPKGTAMPKVPSASVDGPGAIPKMQAADDGAAPKMPAMPAMPEASPAAPADGAAPGIEESSDQDPMLVSHYWISPAFIRAFEILEDLQEWM